MGDDVKVESDENDKFINFNKFIVVFFALFGVFSFSVLVLAVVFIFMFPQSFRGATYITPMADDFFLYNEMKEAEEKEKIDEKLDAAREKLRKRKKQRDSIFRK